MCREKNYQQRYFTLKNPELYFAAPFNERNVIMLGRMLQHPHPGAGYSQIDMDMVNMFKYRQVAEIPWKWATLKPGDCIYVPASEYIHYAIVCVHCMCSQVSTFTVPYGYSTLSCVVAPPPEYV